VFHFTPNLITCSHTLLACLCGTKIFRRFVEQVEDNSSLICQEGQLSWRAAKPFTCETYAFLEALRRFWGWCFILFQTWFAATFKFLEPALCSILYYGFLSVFEEIQKHWFWFSPLVIMTNKKKRCHGSKLWKPCSSKFWLAISENANLISI